MNNLCEYEEITKEFFEKDIYDIIENRDFQHYLLFYWKAQRAAHFYKDFHLARKYIEKAIELKDTSDDVGLRKYIMERDPMMLSIVASPKNRQIYGLAGIIYACLKDEKKSNDYFKCYHQTLIKDYCSKHVHDVECYSLYSFRKVSNHSLSDLANKTISFAHPQKMNDPFDTIAIKWSEEENLRQIIGETKEHISIYHNSFRYYRIRSFVKEVKGDEAYKKIKMWSHYADDHKGFCIKYRLSEKFFCKNEDITRICFPIIYRDNHETLQNNKIKFFDAFQIKAKCWEEEKECRVLSYNVNNEGPFNCEKLDSDSYVEEIIFGYQCAEEEKKTIFNILKNSKHGVVFSEIYVDMKGNIFNLLKRPYHGPN
ncbi:MAG: DUF2971 domain-containing protein [Prevotella sp.]|nr:DUF2971 domain-containing protein [Prevotella sp.]